MTRRIRVELPGGVIPVVVDPAHVYRDATLSKATRDLLQQALDLRALAFPLKPESFDAIRDVVERSWDENATTEVVAETGAEA